MPREIYLMNMINMLDEMLKDLWTAEQRADLVKRQLFFRLELRTLLSKKVG